MKRFLILSGFLLILGGASAQDEAKFSVNVSGDSILFGNYFQVKFTLENAEGSNFEAPVFEGFNIVSGPNFSSNISIINGDVSRSVSYTYYLEPKDVGNFFLQPAAIQVGEQILETHPLEVMVVPNPDGIIQRPEEKKFRFQFDRNQTPGIPPSPGQKTKKKKKKRKTYKI